MIERKWYRIAEVAQMIGLSRQSVLEKVKSGTIPCDKTLGPRSWRIPASWVESPQDFATTGATTELNNAGHSLSRSGQAQARPIVNKGGRKRKNPS